MRCIVLSLCAGSLLTASAAHADVVTEWNQALLNKIAAASMSPPAASRAMAMVHTAVFDAVNAVDQTHNGYLYTGVAAPGTSREAAASTAAFNVMTGLFGNDATFATLYAGHTATYGANPGFADGVTLGNTVGAGMLAARASDGATSPSTYTVVGGVGQWRPTPPANANPAVPQWANLTPFTMNSSSQFRPIAAPALTSAEYTAAWDEVRRLGSVNSAERTAAQTDIARVWQGGAGTPTPPGQWNQIAQQLAASEGNTLSENAHLFALLGLAEADAAVAAWDCKYTYDVWRPITAIREADTDGNNDTAADPTWTPLLITPNHPSYSSGHSTFSRAAGTILQEFFGTDALSFTFSAADAPGILINYTSINDAVNDAGMSRIFGGIHYQFDNQFGQECGAAVGNWVFDNYLTAVPAPSAATGLALAGLVAARRKRR